MSSSNNPVSVISRVLIGPDLVFYSPTYQRAVTSRNSKLNRRGKNLDMNLLTRQPLNELRG